MLFYHNINIISIKKCKSRTKYFARLFLVAAIFKRLTVSAFHNGGVSFVSSNVYMGQAAVICVFAMMLTILNGTGNRFISFHTKNLLKEIRF
jgi:hypothetical protein